MYIGDLIDFCSEFIYGSGKAVQWVFNPVQFGSFSIAPIYLLSFGGLLIYLAVAIIKWAIV